MITYSDWTFLVIRLISTTQEISYKQGMNYLLAPFFVIGLNDTEEIYTCYKAFLGRFLPNTFTDDEFGGRLQRDHH